MAEHVFVPQNLPTMGQSTSWSWESQQHGVEQPSPVRMSFVDEATAVLLPRMAE